MLAAARHRGSLRLTVIQQGRRTGVQVTLVYNPQMAEREVAEVADLPAGKPVTDPFPVQRNPVAGLQIADHADAVDGAHRRLDLRFSKAEQVTVPGQRAGLDDNLVTGHCAPLPPTDPAAVQHGECLLGLPTVAQQTGPGIYAEHREAV